MKLVGTPSRVIDTALPGEARVADAAAASLRRERRGLRAALPFLGPAFVAAVAYVDPGNFATNIAAGSQFGYLLLWVILASNLMAMLIQSMSAKLGIATGMNLPEVVPGPVLAPDLAWASGCRPRSSPWPPTWPSSSARPSASTCSSACRSSGPGC